MVEDGVDGRKWRFWPTSRRRWAEKAAAATAKRRGRALSAGFAVLIALSGALIMMAGVDAHGAGAADLTGHWQCCGAGGASEQDWLISGSGGSGEIPGGGVFASIKATLKGDHVTIVTTYNQFAPGYVATFTGTLAAGGSTMSGSWVSNRSQAGTWTATLVSSAPGTPSKLPTKGTSLSSGHRSTIAAALVPFDKAFPLTGRTLVNATLTLVAMMLITFPAQLFNKTLDENYGEIRGMVAARLPLLVRLRRYVKRQAAREGTKAPFVTVMLVGSIIGGLNDPSFGVTVKSLETFIAVILAFVASMTISARATYLYRRHQDLSTEWRLHAHPAGLVLAFVCMLISRMTNFEPGYLYGVIAGVAFTTEIGAREQGKDIALTSLLVLVVAAISWAIWTPVSHMAAHSHPDPLILIADTFFGGLFVSGIVGSVISLFPLQFLPGSVLFRWHKGVWAAIFAVAMFLLIQVMLLPPARSSRLGDAPFVTTIVLFVVFGALSVAFNRYFAAREKQRQEGERALDGEGDESSPDQTVLGAATSESEVRPGGIR
jgi:hypothetical protein